MRLLLVSLLLFFTNPVMAQGTDLLWEQYFDAAQRAFEQGNYLEAHRMFNETSHEASKCQQEVQLAKRLEALAEKYASIHRFKVAEALYKQAIKIYEKTLGASHINVAQAIRKYAGLLRSTRRDEQARSLEMKAVAILGSDHS